MGEVLALIGAQWGSEGKGVIAHRLASSMRWAGAVRVGGPNAGHSFIEKGQLFKMRSVPCAWVQPETRLVVGAGGVLNADVLLAELDAIEAFQGFPPAIYVDGRAVVVTHHDEEAEVDIKASIGSTGEGVGAARIAKIKRDGSAHLAMESRLARDSRIAVVYDASVLIEDLLAEGDVMLEGTQGSALSLHHGDYPFVTSTDTNASGIAAEAGIAPSRVHHTHLVARSYPIRVGGNSGPMGEELGWEEFIAAGKVEVPERTTVTNKVRRIADWSWDEIAAAIRYNRPCGIWLTFGDYLDPAVRGLTDWAAVMDSRAVAQRVDEIEQRCGLPVLGVGTGGDGWQVATSDSTCYHSMPAPERDWWFG